MKTSEVDVEELKAYIIDLKKKMMIYIPVKDDPIDVALADFINNYPDRWKLRVVFIREDCGVYHFGSKKISIRLEKGKLFVRVGGGYISIEEFLD